MIDPDRDDLIKEAEKFYFTPKKTESQEHADRMTAYFNYEDEY